MDFQAEMAVQLGLAQAVAEQVEQVQEQVANHSTTDKVAEVYQVQLAE
jgi:hypothetical protein